MDKVIKPSIKTGLCRATVYFIVNGLDLPDEAMSDLKIIALKCGNEVEGVSFKTARNNHGRVMGLGVYFAFHYKSAEDADFLAEENIAYLLGERFVGLLSFTIGLRLTISNRRLYLFKDDGSITQRVHPTGLAPGNRFDIKISQNILENNITNEVFKALFWFRRGLSEKDHISAFSALMIVLEILSRVLVSSDTTTNKCPKCGHELSKLTRSCVRDLVVGQLGYEKKRFDRIWKARNAITAHGNTVVTPKIMRDIVEMKFDSIVLCFKALKLSIGIPIEESPYPHQINFITDPFLYSE